MDTKNKDTQTTEKKKREKNAFAKDPRNIDTLSKNIEDDKMYEGVKKVKGFDPIVRLDRQDKNLYRTSDARVSLEQWCHLIYGWLMLNPQMLSIHDFYMHLSNAPFLYSLEQVIQYDSDEIYNLLQERIKVNMLRGKIPRESALAVLRECYGWERPDNNLNVNFQSEIGFRFGGAIPTDNNDNTSEESK